MRILIVADIVGGVRTFVTELARELAGDAHEVHLALIGPRSAAPALPVASCQVTDLRLEWMPDSDADVAATAAWVAELCERVRPDVLHMNTFAPVVDSAVPVLLTAHSCVLTWWRAVHGVRRAARVGGLPAAGGVRDGPRRRDRDAQPGAGARAGGSLRAGRGVGDPPRPAVTAPPRARERLVVTAGRLWDPAKNLALVAAAAPEIGGARRRDRPGGRRWARAHRRARGALACSTGSRALRCSPSPRATSPSGWRRWRPRYAVARSCSATSPACVRSVGKPRAYVPADDPEPLAATVCGLLGGSPGGPRRSGGVLSARAAQYRPEPPPAIPAPYASRRGSRQVAA